MDARDWDWTRIVIDHIDVHASNYSDSVRFYETVLTRLGIPGVGRSDEATCFINVNAVDRTPATTSAVPDTVSATGDSSVVAQPTPALQGEV